MALLLHTVKQSRWHKAEARPWLGAGDVPAEAVSDLRASQNRLSVWEILPDRSNLERVVRAVALTKNKPDATGYLVFDSNLLPPIDIAMTDVPGGTPDQGANGWHRDLVELSGTKLVQLTRVMLEHGETGQVLKKRLCQLVEAGLQSGELPSKFRNWLDQRPCDVCGR